GALHYVDVAPEAAPCDADFGAFDPVLDEQLAAGLVAAGAGEAGSQFFVRLDAKHAPAARGPRRFASDRVAEVARGCNGGLRIVHFTKRNRGCAGALQGAAHRA